MHLICGSRGICSASGLPTMRRFIARADRRQTTCLIASGNGSRPASSNLHPSKTRIVYCKDINRTGDHPDIQFTFLSHTFRPRKAVNKYGGVYVNFSPAVSRVSLKAMRQTIRGWHLQLKSDKSLAGLSAISAPILKGWQQYYGRFHGSALKPVWQNMNLFLTRWAQVQGLTGHEPRSAEMLKRLAQGQPGAFVHWSLGVVS